MHDSGYSVFREYRAEPLGVADVAAAKITPFNEFPVPGAKIINDNGPVTFFIEGFVYMGSDVAGPAGDEYSVSGIHCFILPET